MLATHSIKINGKWYKAGEKLPALNTVTEEGKENILTKTDINRMSVIELKELAKSEKIEGFEEMTGAELKKVLIEKYGL